MRGIEDRDRDYCSLGGMRLTVLRNSRVMPEVPQNMQEDLQRMELEARETDPRRATGEPSAHSRDISFQSYVKAKQPAAPPPAAAKPLTAGSFSDMDAPSFSPFPKVAGENIPPSDEEKEEILYRAREHVLHSNNVGMQIAWARDALMWVEVQAEAQAREWKRQNKGRDRERPPTPRVEHDIRVEAVNIVEYLASQDHPEATFMKAKWQEFGKFGQRENKKDAYLGYKKAAGMGFGRAEYRIGMLYENANDTDKAIKHYNQGAVLKDSAANYRLGMMYLMGQHGYPKDAERGVEMIQMAADAADEDAPQGAYVYGMLIARELPDVNIPEFLLPVELSVARQYIEKAAYLGFAKAQLKMGQAYELSQLACDFNPAYSLHYYGLAARQGQPEAALGVSRWFLFGYEGVFPKNEQLAYKYGEQAADAGLATGEFAMGYYYEIGIHVPRDVRQARNWYELAAEHGNKDAKERLQGLNNSQTLTKKDHETTTLTRIKSQHGSQRGKRPERFSRPNDTMPTLAETPADDERRPPVPDKGPSPRVSPQPSPRRGPTIVEDNIEFPDPERQSTMNSRPPAFTINLDNNLAVRPKSAAPYPEDDRPPPLNLSRPKSTAPYPDDDVVPNKRPLSPHFNPSIRPSAATGPHADRPMSAFGIRPLSGAPQNLQPSFDPRGRASAAPSLGTGWEPQVPGSYRQPSASPSRSEYPIRQSSAQPTPKYDPLPSQRLGAASAGPGVTVPAGTIPVGDPTRNRLQKQHPVLDKPQPAGPPPGQFPMSGYGAQPAARPATTQPGRDYGPRTSSRPTSDVYDRYGSVPPAGTGRLQSAGNGAARPDRMDSLPVSGGQGHNRMPSGGAGRPAPNVRPGHLDPSPGRSSAPPSQAQRPAPPSATNTAHSNASMTSLPGQFNPRPTGGKPPAASVAHPDGKTMGQGPSTFEEMGIPQGKNESDCVSYDELILSSFEWLTNGFPGCHVNWVAAHGMCIYIDIGEQRLVCH
jgi:TPR repeat protein